MRAHGADELGRVDRAALAQRVGFNILVEQLIRVELRAVGRLNPQAWTSEAKCADPLDKWLRLLRRETLRSRAFLVACAPGDCRGASGAMSGKSLDSKVSVLDTNRPCERMQRLT
jgi:hypothetical protein